MIAYFDCFSGISGDMILGALVDAGVSLEALKKELSKLPVSGYELKVKKVKRSGFSATKVDVVLYNPSQSPLTKGGLKGGQPSAKKWKDVQKIIKTSSLSQDIKAKGLLIFKRLFEAEAKVHGEKIQDVHLHELGAIDCIVDIFGALIGLDMLGITEIYSSPLNVGGGTVKTAHGILPVPAPATLELLKGVPIYSSGVEHELTTPTGAVIISSLSKGFMPFPDMKVSGTGIGAGGKDLKEQPNVLRILIGENTPLPLLKAPTVGLDRGENFPTLKKGEKGGFSDKNITVIETNIDDMNPQVYEYVMKRLFKTGALDVWLTNIIMKKGRPGIKLTVICDDGKRDELSKVIFTETTSIGIRFYTAGREVLAREIKSVKTKFGNINVKVSSLDGKILKTTPEYDDCKKIAKKHGIPLLEVMKKVSGKS
ncbi:MAG: nickel pincer cofactor biosynthesis protein LarC [Thermodesulfovibrionia bacterium]|nr:nickel pincer cofactor biosynthesis protein LarC [Thermodesulfovibrionia bacterium]